MLQQIYDEDYLNFYDRDKCIGDLGEKCCNFKWRIYNLHLNPQKILKSHIFTTRLFPTAHWYLEILLSSPGELKTMEISLNRLQNYDSYDLFVEIIYKIISDEKVETSVKKIIEYHSKRLKDDRPFSASFYKSKNYLTVECKLRPHKRMIQDVCHRNLDKTLPIHLRSLLQTNELFDTIIIVGEYKIKAHIAILMARLPQLLSKCYVPSKEDGEHIINIKDLPFSVVRELMKYAYTGQAYVDVESLPVSKDVYISYSQKFYDSCCWYDNPFANTFISYETDSLSWYLKDVFEKSHLGSKSIDLLRQYPSKFTFSLDVEESEKDGKSLMLTFEFLHEKMPKPIIVSCNTFLVNRKNNEACELGETESLLEFRITKDSMKLCSLDDVKKKGETLCCMDDSLFLQADLKFCYGSCTSSIENLYEGKFDISKCTGCPQLSADMEMLYRNSYFSDIIVESVDGDEMQAHKAILLARWPTPLRLEFKKKYEVLIVKNGEREVNNFLLQIYKGFA